MSEMQAEGVTQGAESPQVSTSDSTPESNNDSGAMQGSEHVTASEGQTSDKETNFAKMRENVNRLKAEREKWLEKEKSLQGAAAIDQMLRTDPRGGIKQIAQALGIDLKSLIEAQQEVAKAESTLPEIDFGQYEPTTAQLLKFLHERASKVDNLEKWKSEFEQRVSQTQERQQQYAIEQNISALENQFYTDLVKEGFIDKNGKGNMDVVEVVKDAIIARLAQHGDPRMATVQQYEAAKAQVLKGFSAINRKTLQNTVTKNVPPSGSRNGSATTAKPTVTKEQRLALLEDMAKNNPSWGFES